MINAQVIHIVLGGFKLAGHAHIHIVQDPKYASVSDHGSVQRKVECMESARSACKDSGAV